MNYPLLPPSIKFQTKIFHPNISRHGDIGIDCLGISAWTQTMTIAKVLLSIQSLFMDPYTFVCMEPSIGKLYQLDREAYFKVARKWTLKYAFVQHASLSDLQLDDEQCDDDEWLCDLYH